MMDIFKILNQTESRAVLLIQGYIGGWDADPSYVRQQLKGFGDVQDIYVTLESGGGSALHGMALYTALKNHPANIHINIEAVAASAAATVAMAASPGCLSIEETAMMMIHEASADVYGPASALRSTANLLEKVNQTVRTAILSRESVQMSDEDIQTAMNNTTWYTAAEAMQAGLVDKVAESDRNITDSDEIQQFDFSIYQNLPDCLKNIAPVENRARQKSSKPDGQSVPTVENKMSKTFTQSELDEAVKNATDELMKRVTQILGHPNSVNQPAALLQITSNSSIDDALKMMDFVQVENKAEEGDKPEEPAAPDTDAIMNLVAEQLAKINQNNIDVPASDSEGGDKPPVMSDEERGAAMVDRINKGIH